MIEVNILRVFFDFISASAMVIVASLDGKKVLPIWVGVFEAQAIQAAIDGEAFKRPLTHDLLYNVITASGGNVEYIMISEVNDNTFYSRIYIKIRDALIDIDSRPSDAVCVAIKIKSKIYVSKEIFAIFEERPQFERKLKDDFYNLFLKNVNKEELKKA